MRRGDGDAVIFEDPPLPHPVAPMQDRIRQAARIGSAVEQSDQAAESIEKLGSFSLEQTPEPCL